MPVLAQLSLLEKKIQISCSFWVLRFPDPAFFPGGRGTSVGEVQPRCMERKDSHILNSGPYNRDRSIPKVWVASNTGVDIGGQWSQGESKLDNFLELLAGVFAIMTFLKSKAQMKARLLVDNVTAAHYVNSMEGTKFPALASLAIDLRVRCLQHNFLVETRSPLPGASISHVPLSQPCPVSFYF